MDQDFISEHIRVFCRLRPDLPEDSSGESDFYLTSASKCTHLSAITFRVQVTMPIPQEPVLHQVQRMENVFITHQLRNVSINSNLMVSSVHRLHKNRLSGISDCSHHMEPLTAIYSCMTYQSNPLWTVH
jgi:hypothetical protein